jgi:hypothetical protein
MARLPMMLMLLVPNAMLYFDSCNTISMGITDKELSRLSSLMKEIHCASVFRAPD